MKCGRLLPLLLSLLLSVSLLKPAAWPGDLSSSRLPGAGSPSPADWSPATPAALMQPGSTSDRRSGGGCLRAPGPLCCCRMTDRFNELLTEYYFCSLDYMRSPASCTQEYVRYSSVCGQAESDYLSAVQEVLNSAYGSVLAGLLGGRLIPPVHSSSRREEFGPLERETALADRALGAVVQALCPVRAAGPGPCNRRTCLSGGLTGGGCLSDPGGGAGRRPQWGPRPYLPGAGKGAQSVRRLQGL